MFECLCEFVCKKYVHHSITRCFQSNRRHVNFVHRDKPHGLLEGVQRIASNYMAFAFLSHFTARTRKPDQNWIQQIKYWTMQNEDDTPNSKRKQNVKRINCNYRFWFRHTDCFDHISWCFVLLWLLIARTMKYLSFDCDCILSHNCMWFSARVLLEPKGGTKRAISFTWQAFNFRFGCCLYWLLSAPFQMDDFFYCLFWLWFLARFTIAKCVWHKMKNDNLLAWRPLLGYFIN